MESADNRPQSPSTNQSEESKDASSLSKTETIKLLNESIDRLESTIKAIGKNPAEDLPSSDSINSLLNTTQELADAVIPPPPPPAAVKTTPKVETNPIPPESPTVTKTVTEDKIAPPTPVKPERKQESELKNTTANHQKQENRGLRIIGAIAVAIAIVAIIWSFLPQIQTTISSISQSSEIIDERPISSQPNPSPAIEIAPIESNIDSETPAIEAPQPSLEEQTEVESDIALETSIPQDLKAPGRATNLKIEAIEPELTFTPEQTLIAALQAKLAEIADNYDSDLFTKAKVDFATNALTVKITDDWYDLNESRQAKLANEILKRSRQLNFDKLELEDGIGTLVARNPVVGDRIIIVQSHKAL